MQLARQHQTVDKNNVIAVARSCVISVECSSVGCLQIVLEINEAYVKCLNKQLEHR